MLHWKLAPESYKLQASSYGFYQEVSWVEAEVFGHHHKTEWDLREGDEETLSICQSVIELVTRESIRQTRPDTRLQKSRAGGQGPCGWAGAVFEVTRPFGQER